MILDGPTLTPYDGLFFLGQITLVWTAYYYLPHTLAEEDHDKKNKPILSVPNSEDHHIRGGHLMKLFKYETICLILLLFLIGCILMSTYDKWQKKCLFFWIRTLYGLLAIPFVPFKVPLISNVLMHTKNMGYDSHGKTVASRKAKAS